MNFHFTTLWYQFLTVVIWTFIFQVGDLHKVFVPVFVFVPLYKSPWPFWGSRFERGVGLVSESCAGMDYYTLYIFNGYTLCKFTLTYTDYMYNILHNITTSEYIGVEAWERGYIS